MAIITGIKKVVKNPYNVIPILNSLRLINWMPDRVFIKLRYKAYMGQSLNLEEPVLFTEKLQWLKLHNRKQENSILVDKYEVHQYLAKRFGEKYLIPITGVWDRFDDIDFSRLPEQFVLKCTHDSGGIVFCTDKSSFDIVAAKKKLEKCMKRNYYWSFREYPYKDVKPRIICEKLMVDESGIELKDYKLFCFNGNPKFVLVDFDRINGHKRNIYNTDWQSVPFVMNRFYPDPDVTFSKPACFDEMLDIASQLSRDHPFLRVDFYIINEELFIGELTFFPGAGLIIFEPREYDRLLGELLELPETTSIDLVGE